MQLTDIKVHSSVHPASRGACTHDRPVAFNLAINAIIHTDDETPCDGDLMIDGKTGWRI